MDTTATRQRAATASGAQLGFLEIGVAARPGATAAGSTAVRTDTVYAGTAAYQDALTRAQNEAREAQRQLTLLEERYAREKEQRCALQREVAQSRAGSASTSQLLEAIGGYAAKQQETQQQEAQQQQETPPLQETRAPAPAEPRSGPQPRACDDARRLRDALAARERQCAELEQQLSAVVDAATRERALHREREAQQAARIEGLSRALEAAHSKRSGLGSSSSGSGAEELQRARQRAEKVERECREVVAEDRAFYHQQFALMDEQLRTLTAVCAAQRHAASMAPTSTAATGATSTTSASSVGGTVAGAAATVAEGETDSTDSGSSSSSTSRGTTMAATLAGVSVELGGAQELKAAVAAYQAYEEAFVHTLELVDETFRKPIVTKLVVDPITRMRLPRIFSNMESIAASAQKLLARAKKACAKRQLTGLGQVLADTAAGAALYERYYQDFEGAILLVAELHKGPAFTKLVTKSEARQSCGGKRLEDFLLVPVAHFAHYARVVGDVCRALPAGHAERAPVAHAAQLFGATAAAWAERLDDARSVCDMVAVSRRLTNSPAALVQAKRRYLVESAAALVDDRGKTHRRHFFVFNDLLLECRVHRVSSSASCAGTSAPDSSSSSSSSSSSARATRYKLLVQTSLNGATVSNLPDTGALTNALRINGVNADVTISFGTADQKYVWLSRLSRTLATIPAPAAAAFTAAAAAAAALRSPPHGTAPPSATSTAATAATTTPSSSSSSSASSPATLAGHASPRTELSERSAHLIRRASNLLLSRRGDGETGRPRRSGTIGGPEGAPQSQLRQSSRHGTGTRKPTSARSSRDVSPMRNHDDHDDNDDNNT